MTLDGTEIMIERLNLRSRLAELAQLNSWVEHLASRYGIPGRTQYAMQLCLEEILSNIILHGYSSDPAHTIEIQFTKVRDDYFAFVVEDDAPRFNPVEAPELPPLGPLDENRIGGQGLRLVRRFADALEYQPTSTGNRLSICFSTAAVEKD